MIKSEESELQPNEYFVERILDKKTVNGKVYYFVKWEDYPISQSTWEPIKNLRKSMDLIYEFERDRKQSKRTVFKKSAKYIFN